MLSGGDTENTYLQFSLFKEKKARKRAKLNAASQIMYVGSSTTGVKKE